MAFRHGDCACCAAQRPKKHIVCQIDSVNTYMNVISSLKFRRNEMFSSNSKLESICDNSCINFRSTDENCDRFNICSIASRDSRSINQYESILISFSLQYCSGQWTRNDYLDWTVKHVSKDLCGKHASFNFSIGANKFTNRLNFVFNLFLIAFIRNVEIDIATVQRSKQKTLLLVIFPFAFSPLSLATSFGNIFQSVSWCNDS